MKIAVFSDVHGNLSALERVLKEIKEENADLVVFLGDVFQRGESAIECLDLLMSNDVVYIKGNCELYMEKGVDIDPDVEYLRDYYDDTRSKLTDEQIEYIKTLPFFHEIDVNGKKIRFSHFLFSNLEDTYPFLQLSDMKNGVFDRACESEEIKKYDLVVIGHSHTIFEKGNVVSVSATGLEGASYLVIDVTESGISYEYKTF